MTGADSPGIKVILLDIEGTVCPISFVKEVLFPYALDVLPETLKSQWDSPQFAPYRDAFPPECASSLATFVHHVKDLMTRDAKTPYLKNLQGYLWENGYRSGQLRAPLFPDVAPRIAAWCQQQNMRIMIYSSGSVPAQKLFFAHTNANPSDLTPMLHDYFDTLNAGPKTERSSYATILSNYLEHPPHRWLFLSDNIHEVVAAKQAGMQSFVVQRPGNPPLPHDACEHHRVIENFVEI